MNTIKPSLVFICIKFELIDKSLPRLLCFFYHCWCNEQPCVADMYICEYMYVIQCNAASSCWYIGCQECKVRLGSPCYHSRFSTLFVMMEEAKKVFRTLVPNWIESFCWWLHQVVQFKQSLREKLPPSSACWYFSTPGLPRLCICTRPELMVGCEPIGLKGGVWRLRCMVLMEMDLISDI
jgi:hypothetical protein